MLDINLQLDVASQHACKFVTDLSDLHILLATSLKSTQDCYQCSSDKVHTPALPINVGDKVFVLAKHIKTTCPTHKLAESCLGPYEVIDTISCNFVWLCLPHELHLIHPVFHVSQIEPSTPNQFADHQDWPPDPNDVFE